MQQIVIAIPAGLDFSALDLSRAADTGGIKFSWMPIEAICRESGIDVEIFRDRHEDNVAGLIVAWYAQHLQRGGERDAIADDLIAEVVAEDNLGAGISHPPGRA